MSEIAYSSDLKLWHKCLCSYMEQFMKKKKTVYSMVISYL